MEERNVYTGKTVQEAVDAALQELGITAEQADITVLEEGKKKLFGSIKAKVKVTKKLSDGARAVEFIDGLMSILGVNAVSEIVSEDEKIEISVTSTDSNKVIGRHGEILDAIQCLAGAVANIGREDYKKVVVDCENYRAGREKTLTELAERLAKEGRLLIVAPDDTCGVDTLTRDKDNLVRLYNKGLEDGREIISFMS